jgi:predicted enzyme related to lactoylglutathione lyase
MGNKVGWFEVAGKDHKGLQKFYGDLFDWKVDASNPMEYGMVESGDAGLGGGIGGLPPEATSGHVTVYVIVDDLQAALDKAVSLGGQIANPPMDVPDGPSIAHFLDPSGNFVGLMKA